MNRQKQAARLMNKTTVEAMQIELQQGYNLSPVEAMVLAQRLRQMVAEQTGFVRQPGQITYQAIALEEPAGKPLRSCRKIPVQLTLQDEGDVQVWAREGAETLRRLRVHRLTYEAYLQGGVLSQEDLACILGISLKTVKRIFAFFRAAGQRLPSRGELKDMGRGVSHKLPIIRRYVQDLSLSKIAQQLGQHGIPSMVRYLRHFALVMVLEDRGLNLGQMQSVIGISANLIAQYRSLYAELNVPEYERTLGRLKRQVFAASGPPVWPGELKGGPR